MFPNVYLRLAIPALAAAILSNSTATAQPLFLNDPVGFPRSMFSDVMREPEQAVPNDEAVEQSPALRERFRRQVVAYNTHEAPGTIVIDTANTYLYYVLGGGRAIRYGIGVGREGFTWSGVQSIARKQEWPDWHPPAEMIARQPYLPRMMAGGPGNPLGARAMYLGNSLYRIHGTNAPDTIGQRVSSGCIRLTNDNITDLFNRVTVGTKVVVLPDSGRHTAPVASVEPRPVPMTVRAQARPQYNAQQQVTVSQQVVTTESPASLPHSPRSSLFTGASASRLD
jgi:lipoprotein-anchoring transpeptidase ErfK/SrfK